MLKGLKIYVGLGFGAVLYLISLCDVYSDRYIPPDRPSVTSDFHDYTGVIHFHTRYSDGSGTFKRILQAAEHENLDFVISADHDTFQPLVEGEEGYKDNVLIIAGAELSTPIAHIVYLNPDSAIADYPTDQIFKNFKDPFIKSGIFIVAHPFLKKRPMLDWDWSGYSEMELVNGDQEWRNDSPLELIQALLAFPFLENSLNYLADIPKRQMAIWDSLLQSRKVFTVGASDIHSNIKISGGRSIHFPSYEKGFQTVQTHLLLRTPLSKNFSIDKKRVIQAIAEGKTYLSFGGFCNPAGFQFYAHTEDSLYVMGETLSAAKNPHLRILVPDTTDIVLKLVKNGNEILNTTEWNLDFPVTGPGIYRVEVYQKRSAFPYFSNRLRPWVFSNPIFITI